MKIVILIALLALNISCTREMKGNISIQLPSYGNTITSKVGSLSTSTWVGNITTYTEVNCYMVLVKAPESTANTNANNPNYCTDTTGSTYYFKQAMGGVPQGSSIDLSVDIGVGQEVILIGMNANTGYCKDFIANGPTDGQISYPRFLASKSIDVVSGDNQVVMTYSDDLSNYPELETCEFQHDGTSPPSSSMQLTFGTGADGNITFSSDVTDISTQTTTDEAGDGVYLSSHFNIKNVSADGRTLTLNGDINSGGFKNFKAGHEVMIVITEAGGGAGGPDDACGSGNYRGKYQFAKVQSVDNSFSAADTISLDSSFFDLSSLSLLNAALSETSNAPDNINEFCRAQVVRVPHFRNITMSAVSSFLSVYGPAYDGFSGGFMPIRVAEKIILDGSTPVISFDAYFKMSERGFGSGTSDTGGHGINGLPVGSGAFGNGGGDGISPSMAAGGGAMAGAGGIGAGASSNGGMIVKNQVGCTTACIAEGDYKIFMGGQGGDTDYDASFSGGKGGGVVMLYAKQVELLGDASYGGKLMVVSNGGMGTMEGGGGAGGTAFIKVQQVLNASASNFVQIEAQGGMGGSSGGGGGGAGYTEMMYCNATDVTNFQEIAFGGAGGGSGGNGSYADGPGHFTSGYGYTLASPYTGSFCSE